MKAAAEGVLLTPTSQLAIKHPPPPHHPPYTHIDIIFLAICAEAGFCLFECFIVNNGWDLGVEWAKSFHAGVLKCGPRPFALAHATSRCSALTDSSNKGCDSAASVFSGARRVTSHTQACTNIRWKH